MKDNRSKTIRKSVKADPESALVVRVLRWSGTYLDNIPPSVHEATERQANSFCFGYIDEWKKKEKKRLTDRDPFGTMNAEE